MKYGGFTLPKGFRFQPSDEELLSYYLQKKNQRKDSQITAIIPEIDMTKHEPRQLPALVFTRADFLEKEWFTMADSPDMECYFFSRRVFKYSNSKTKTKTKSKSKSTMIDRTTKEGSWKKQGNDRRITAAGSDKHIGGRRILTFYLRENQKTDWVIHEYYLTNANSGEQIGDFVLCRLKDNRLKKKPGKSDHDQQDAPLLNEDQASGELGNDVVTLNGTDDAAEHGGGSCHIASGMLTQAEEYQGFEALQDALFESDGNQELRGSQTGPYYDKNDFPFYVEGQPDSYNSPDSGMVEVELLHEPGAQALLHPPPTTQLQSPIYTKPGTNNFLNDEYRKRKYPFEDTRDTKKIHTDEVDSTPSSNSENQAADATPEGYSQPGGNIGPYSFWPQELLSINREPRDLPHDNNFIEWDDLPTITEGFESSLASFSDTFIDGGISDRNIESTYGSVNDYFALAIGEPSNVANQYLFIGEYQSNHQ